MKILGKLWSEWTTGEKVYLAFWIIFFYILLGMIIQDRMALESFLKVILWPFIEMGLT